MDNSLMCLCSCLRFQQHCTTKMFQPYKYNIKDLSSRCRQYLLKYSKQTVLKFNAAPSFFVLRLRVTKKEAMNNEQFEMCDWSQRTQTLKNSCVMNTCKVLHNAH